jgi:glycosyltransferase involved in cell wall biosynthesis
MMNKFRPVALFAFKNEEKFLKSLVSSLTGVVDEIVAIDDFSTDRSVEVLEKASREFKIPILISPGIAEKKDYPVEKLRQKLLELGRQRNGTHFVCLDADEAFTANFHLKAKKVMETLLPGQKITMQWLAMWKSLDHYRDDKSVWSNNFKDFIVCDDGKISAEEGLIHKGRTPGNNSEDMLIRLNPKYGAVFHYQFSDWKSFQIKQAWYRCIEKTLSNKSDDSINQTYKITMEDPNALVTAIPEEWRSKSNCLPSLNLYEDHRKNNWHLQEIRKMIKQHGVEKFKGLQIWHILEIQELSSEGG